MQNSKWFRWLMIIAVAVMMTACGGGGGANPDNNDTNSSGDIPLPTLTVATDNGNSGHLLITITGVDTEKLSKIKLYRNNVDNSGSKSLVKEIAVSGSSITLHDDGLEGCATYYYWIEACSEDSGSESCRQTESSKSAKTVPDAPQNLKAYASIIRSLNMQWDDNPDGGCTVKYHLYQKTTADGDFTKISEINDLTSGATGATETNVDGGVYIHYRVQAEDADGHKSSLSCSVASGYPQYGVSSEQDSCRAAVGYTWGDQPNYPWASVNGYTDKVIFTWDDVPLILNSDGSVNTYANAYRIRFKTGGAWSSYTTMQNPFTQNGVQYQKFTVTNVSGNTSVTLEVQTIYNYDNDGDGTPELTYSDPIQITGKTAASSNQTGGTAPLGLPPAAVASTYYPGKIMVSWTPTSGATSYKLYAKEVFSSCPTDSNNPIAQGYSFLTNTTSTSYDHMVSWKKMCYRVRACNASGCGAFGPHAYGSSTGN